MRASKHSLDTGQHPSQTPSVNSEHCAKTLSLPVRRTGVFLRLLSSGLIAVAVIFPAIAADSASDWPAWRDEQAKEKPKLKIFWAQLARGWEFVEQDHRPPTFTVSKDGAYNCTSGR